MFSLLCAPTYLRLDRVDAQHTPGNEHRHCARSAESLRVQRLVEAAENNCQHDIIQCYTFLYNTSDRYLRVYTTIISTANNLLWRRND